MYEEADEVGGPSNLYVHHDILLPAFPLSLAWLDCGPSGRTQSGNLAAVGTMNPGIEIWDLDVIDTVEPVATLGGELQQGGAPENGKEQNSKQKKREKKASKKVALFQHPHMPGCSPDARQTTIASLIHEVMSHSPKGDNE